MQCRYGNNKRIGNGASKNCARRERSTFQLSLRIGYLDVDSHRACCRINSWAQSRDPSLKGCAVRKKLNCLSARDGICLPLWNRSSQLENVVSNEREQL